MHYQPTTTREGATSLIVNGQGQTLTCARSLPVIYSNCAVLLTVTMAASVKVLGRIT